MSAKFESVWLDLIDATADAEEARGLPRRNIDALLAELENFRAIVCDDDVRAALRALAGLDSVHFLMLEPRNRFCGREILGTA